MAAFDPEAIRRLVETICTDPEVRLQTDTGLVVRPIWPPRFESLPHPDSVCQAAVKVVVDGGTQFNVSLCDVVVHQPVLAQPLLLAA
jgi:hypothetical protein